MKETLSYQLPTSKCVGFLRKFAPTTVGAIQKRKKHCQFMEMEMCWLIIKVLPFPKLT